MHLRPMTRADLSACAAAGCAAFVNDPFTNLQFPHRRQFPEAYHRAALQRLQFSIVKPGNWCNVCVEEVDGKEEILGYAIWNRQTAGADSAGSKSSYLKSNTTFGNWVERTLRGYEEMYTFNARLNPTIDHAFMQKYVRSSSPIAGPFSTLPDQWYLVSLCVRPECQGKGVGKKLVQWGLDRCREERDLYAGAPLPAALIASGPGHGLYLKMGFRTITWLGEELNIGGGAIMVWDETDTFVRPLKEDEPTVTKGGRPVQCVFRGKEEQKLAALERSASPGDVIQLDKGTSSRDAAPPYTVDRSEQGFM